MVTPGAHDEERTHAELLINDDSYSARDHMKRKEPAAHIDRRGLLYLLSVVALTALMCLILGTMPLSRPYAHRYGMAVYCTSQSVLVAVDVATGESRGSLNASNIIPPGRMGASSLTAVGTQVYVTAENSVYVLELACFNQSASFILASDVPERPPKNGHLGPYSGIVHLESTGEAGKGSSADGVVAVLYTGDFNVVHAARANGDVYVVDAGAQSVTGSYTIDTASTGAIYFGFSAKLPQQRCSGAETAVTGLIRLKSPASWGEDEDTFPWSVAHDDTTVYMGGLVGNKPDIKGRPYVAWARLKDDGSYQVAAQHVSDDLKCGQDTAVEDAVFHLNVSPDRGSGSLLMALSRTCAWLLDNHTLEVLHAEPLDPPVQEGSANSRTGGIVVLEEANPARLLYISITSGGEGNSHGLRQQYQDTDRLDGTSKHDVAVSHDGSGEIVVGGVAENKRGNGKVDSVFFTSYGAFV